MSQVTPFLWFDNQAEEAAKLYVSIFPNSKILALTPMTAVFEVNGQRIIALNGGPMYKFTEAFSLSVSCETQAEIDTYWARLTENGGEEGRCGWLKDKFGLSWQITPTALSWMLGDPDPAKAQRVVAAMMTMKKMDIAALQQAFEGQR